MSTVHLSSSLRTTPPEVTLQRAKARARGLGISRVTDITRLDRVGIPVYASIRPSAVVGSLCVSAGKGLHPIEAEVGAYMEAIEFALAEPGASHVATVRATARDVLDGRTRAEAILDLCPRAGARVRLDAPLDCVEVEEITTCERALVPAELVFVPFRPHARFLGLFGATSNGLASGNSLQEATVHGLCEVIERDVRSFEVVRDTSVPVDLATVDEPGRSLVEAVRAADLELYVRTVRNPFGVPVFLRDHPRPRCVRPAPAQRRLRLPSAPQRGVRARRSGGRAEPALVHPRRSRRSRHDARALPRVERAPKAGLRRVGREEGFAGGGGADAGGQTITAPR